MQIVVPSRFLHASELDPRWASLDPRKPTFTEHELDVDLRDCGFIQPPGLLWCAIYELLAVSRGTACRLLVPENLGVCIYLKSVGLFKLLQDHGVEVDDRGIGTSASPQLILPLTPFNSASEVEHLANDALDRLRESSVGAANLYPVVSEIFAELGLNAVQHSESQIGALGLIQFYDSEFSRRFVCTVADGGNRDPALFGKEPGCQEQGCLRLERDRTCSGRRDLRNRVKNKRHWHVRDCRRHAPTRSSTYHSLWYRHDAPDRRTFLEAVRDSNASIVPGNPSVGIHTLLKVVSGIL